MNISGDLRILDIEESNKILSKKVLTEEPFFVSRVGFYELGRMTTFIRGGRSLRDKTKFFREFLKDPAYSLRVERIWKVFSQFYLEGYLAADIQCVWVGTRMDEQMALLSKCGDAVVAIDALGLEPYRSVNPWTSALAGKRVLLVSPFVGDFQAQYLKRKRIWAGRESVLPDFELVSYRSEFYFKETANWIAVLEKIKNEISELEFDIALLSCGPLGLPLGGFIRNDLKKPAIYMGAALQILFGVTGARWDSSDYFKELINESWIRPSGTKPASADKLDKSCYW